MPAMAGERDSTQLTTNDMLRPIKPINFSFVQSLHFHNVGCFDSCAALPHNMVDEDPIVRNGLACTTLVFSQGRDTGKPSDFCPVRLVLKRFDAEDFKYLYIHLSGFGNLSFIGEFVGCIEIKSSLDDVSSAAALAAMYTLSGDERFFGNLNTGTGPISSSRYFENLNLQLLNFGFTPVVPQFSGEFFVVPYQGYIDHRSGLILWLNEDYLVGSSITTCGCLNSLSGTDWNLLPGRKIPTLEEVAKGTSGLSRVLALHCRRELSESFATNLVDLRHLSPKQMQIAYKIAVGKMETTYDMMTGLPPVSCKERYLAIISALMSFVGADIVPTLFRQIFDCFKSQPPGTETRMVLSSLPNLTAMAEHRFSSPEISSLEVADIVSGRWFFQSGVWSWTKPMQWLPFQIPRATGHYLLGRPPSDGNTILTKLPAEIMRRIIRSHADHKTAVAMGQTEAFRPLVDKYRFTMKERTWLNDDFQDYVNRTFRPHDGKKRLCMKCFRFRLAVQSNHCGARRRNGGRTGRVFSETWTKKDWVWSGRMHGEANSAVEGFALRRKWYCAPCARALGTKYPDLHPRVWRRHEKERVVDEERLQQAAVDANSMGPVEDT